MNTVLRVWSATPFDLPAQLPLEHHWQSTTGAWVFDYGSWQISVAQERAVTPRPTVAAKLPGASFVAYVSLLSEDANGTGYMMLESTVRSLAAATLGVWVDVDEQAFAAAEGHFGLGDSPR